MGMQTTTTNLTYARDTYIKQGRSHIFDRVGDMIYYVLTNNDIACTRTNTLTVGSDGSGHDVKFFGDTSTCYWLWDQSADEVVLAGRINFADDASRTGEGACLFANGVSIGMATPGDCQGVKMEFDYGVTPTLTTGKMVHGLDIKMTMDQDWSIATKPYNATVRGARIQAESEDNISGRLTGAYINARAFGDDKEIEGYISGVAGPGIIGIQARTEICTSSSIPSTTITTPAAVGVMIYHHCKANATLTGGYRALQIEQPLILAGGSISSTTYAMYVGNDWGGSDDFDYGLYIKTSTCTIAIQTGASGSDGGDVRFYGASTGEAVLWDSSAATLDITSTLAAADVVESITITDSATVNAGRGIGLGVYYTGSGTFTGTYGIRSTRVNTTISANVPNVIVGDWYLATIADKTVDYIFGLSMYWEDIGDNIDSVCMIDLGKNMTSDSATRDCFIRCREHTGVRSNSSILRLEGTNAAAFLVDFETQAGTGQSILATGSDTTDVTYKIAVRLTAHSATKYIHLFDS